MAVPKLAFSATETLIGRDGEPQRIADLLTEYSLVTLVGPGGVGKTTLAMQLASTLRNGFEGGVFVAELAGTSDDDDVAGLVARQLDATSLEALRLRSAGRATLVVLDNCESALRASREIARELFTGDSGIRVLATSRSPLYALGERLVPIRPLAVSDDAGGTSDVHLSLSAAEDLFLTRAKEAGATWPHTRDNLRAVRQLTHQLNGLPLAIELAAARSRVLGPVELFDLLDRQLDVLVRPGASGERHHSLRSVIASSYEPLSEPLRHFLRCLAFMSAPFDLRLAHAVDGTQPSELDSLDLLSQLIDASLVDSRQTASGRTEYLLLDSIRAFGREKLAEADETNNAGERYADEVAAISGDIIAAALQAFSPEVMGTIRDNFSHLVNAVTWCIDHDPSPARSYQMFIPFYGPTGASTEIADLARRVRDAWDSSAPLQAEAYAVMGSLTFRTGRYEEGAELAAMAVGHPEATDLARLMGRRTLGYMEAVNRRGDAAIEHIDSAVAIGASLGASFGREIRVSRAAMVWDPSGSPNALESLREVSVEATDAGEWLMVVWAGTTSAYHHWLLGDMPAARRAAENTLMAAEGSGMPWAVCTSHRCVASMLAITEGWAAAAPHFRTALDTTIVVGDVDGCAAVLRAAAGAASFTGNADLAQALWATIPPRPGIPVPPSVFDEIEQAMAGELSPATGVSTEVLVRAAQDLLGEPVGAATNLRDGDALADAVPSGVIPSHGGAPEGIQEGITVCFGDFELDPQMCELRRDGVRIAMEPQVYDVLLYLVERRGSVVTKNELLDEVWGDRFVSESALSSRIAAARRATGDNGKAQRVIRTVHGKGFSFIAETA